MKTPHTPGPWHPTALRTHGADSSRNGCDISAENGANIAIALHQAQDRNPRETIANAHLLATAPELLHLLAELLVTCDHALAQGSASISVDNTPSGWLSRARATAAKARGQS
ncbi:MAG: hypothetical protein V4772_03275 [Pseudomonadota bacterium]